MMMRPTWARCFASVLLLAACGGDTDLNVSPLRPGGGQGSGSGSGSGSGTGTGPGTGCTALAQCCATSLPPQAQMGCSELVGSGDVTACDQALAELAQAGYCTEGSGSGSGTPPCEELGACCSLLPPAALASCQAIVSENNQAVCAENYTTAQSAGYCNTVSPPESPDCSQLSACCTSLPETDQGECQTIAQANDGLQCTTALDQLTQAGLCMGVGGIHPGG
jgi:hypothetical protein